MEYTSVTSESNLLFWRLDVAYFREKKELTFYDPAGPVKEMAILQQGPRHMRTQNTTVYTDKSNNKTHSLMIKLAMYSNICITFYLFLDLSCSNDYGVPYKFAQAIRRSRPLLCDVTLPWIGHRQTHENNRDSLSLLQQNLTNLCYYRTTISVIRKRAKLILEESLMSLI